jgi:predicted secreted protein
MLKSWCAALLVVGLTAGPALAGDQHYRVVATDPKNHSQVEVPLGDQLVLRLQRCGGCGYAWRVVHKPDASVIAYSREMSAQQDPSSCKNCAGVPEHQRFLFTSKGHGETTVKLGYFPPGRSKAQKFKVLTLHVIG